MAWRWAVLLSVLPAASLSAQSPTDGASNWVETLVGMDPENLAAPLRLVVLVTVFGVVPSLVLLTTCFPRIFIVLSFLRRALGTQELPPTQIVAGLAFLLTALVMLPVWQRVHTEAYVPLVNGEIKSIDVAFARASKPVKAWMVSHTPKEDFGLFLQTLTRAESATRATARVETATAEVGFVEPSPSRFSTTDRLEDLDFFVVLPAFVLSELKLAFQMGFLIYLPFLVIDLAVSAILISMGMFMLPPILISLPLKVLVFVLADGWNVVVVQLLEGLL